MTKMMNTGDYTDPANCSTEDLLTRLDKLLKLQQRHVKRLVKLNEHILSGGPGEHVELGYELLQLVDALDPLLGADARELGQRHLTRSQQEQFRHLAEEADKLIEANRLVREQGTSLRVRTAS